MIDLEDSDLDKIAEKEYQEAIDRQAQRNSYNDKITGTMAGRDYVDLGLSDGTLFATCNSGAEYPWEVGGAYKTLDEPWIVPSTEQLRTLVDECRWMPAQIERRWGFIIQGPNKNEIFLPTSFPWIKPLPYRPGDFIPIQSPPIGDEYISSNGNGLDFCPQDLVMDIGYTGQYGNYREFCRPVLKYSADSIEIFANQNQHLESIDLGLSLKWSPINLGSRQPEDKGWKFQWGGNRPIDKDTDLGSDLTHLNNESIGGEITKDTATNILGKNWRLPTKAEFDELISACTWEKIFEDYTLTGYRVIGPNGNSIILPLTDGIKPESHHEKWMIMTGGSYWSSDSCEEDVTMKNAWCLRFNNHGQDVYWNHIWKPKAIRPVHD